MLKSVGMALLAAMVMASFASTSFAQTEIEKLWQASGYATPGQGMRTMEIMHMMDTNKDSKVSKKEFMHYYEMVWEKMDPGHLGQIGVNKWIGQ